jgi:hypothetical protein
MSLLQSEAIDAEPAAHLGPGALPPWPARAELLLSVGKQTPWCAAQTKSKQSLRFLRGFWFRLLPGTDAMKSAASSPAKTVLRLGCLHLYKSAALLLIPCPETTRQRFGNRLGDPALPPPAVDAAAGAVSLATACWLVVALSGGLENSSPSPLISPPSSCARTTPLLGFHQGLPSRRRSGRDGWREAFTSGATAVWSGHPVTRYDSRGSALFLAPHGVSRSRLDHLGVAWNFGHGASMATGRLVSREWRQRWTVGSLKRDSDQIWALVGVDHRSRYGRSGLDHKATIRLMRPWPLIPDRREWIWPREIKSESLMLDWRDGVGYRFGCVGF